MLDPEKVDAEREWETEGEIASLIAQALHVSEEQCKQVSKEILEYVVSIFRPDLMQREFETPPEEEADQSEV